MWGELRYPYFFYTSYFFRSSKRPSLEVINMRVYQHRRSVGQCAYHLVLVPKYRHKVFADEQVKKTCEIVLCDVAKQLNCLPQAIEVMEDHVHLFLDMDYRQSLPKVFHRLKGTTSRILLMYFPELKRKYFWGGNLWSKGKFFRSVGCVTDETVKRYIEQSQHNDFQKSLWEF